MKFAYIVTKNLELYSDNRFFFPTLEVSRNLSVKEIRDAFPVASEVIAHFTIKSAESAVRVSRRLALVNIHPRFFNGLDIWAFTSGYTYRSTKTPIILEVALKDDLDIQNDKYRLIDRTLIDFNTPAKTISIEDGHTGTMPELINIEEVEQSHRCKIL